jgi:hypothetical protein
MHVSAALALLQACSLVPKSAFLKQSRPQPVAEYLFEESTQPGLDTSGHGNELNSIGAVRTNWDPIRGKVLFCDGDGSYLTFVPANEGDGLSASIPTENSPYTLSAWIFPKASQENGIIGWGHYGENGAVTSLQTQGVASILNVWWSNDLAIDVGLYKDKWSHVACTFNGTSRACFWNGEEKGRDLPNPHSARSEYLHVCHTHHAEYFNGYLDDVRVFDVAITQEHIAQLAAPPEDPPPDPDPTSAPTPTPTSIPTAPTPEAIAPTTLEPTMKPTELTSLELTPDEVTAPTIASTNYGDSDAATAATTATAADPAAAMAAAMSADGGVHPPLIGGGAHPPLPHQASLPHFLAGLVHSGWVGSLDLQEGAKKNSFDHYMLDIDSVVQGAGGKYAGYYSGRVYSVCTVLPLPMPSALSDFRYYSGTGRHSPDRMKVPKDAVKIQIDVTDRSKKIFAIKYSDVESLCVGVLDLNAGTLDGKVYQVQSIAYSTTYV